MDSKQALELTVLWQETNDALGRMQEAAPDNTFVQEIEAIREKLGEVVSGAVNGNGNGPDWGDIIPIRGEVHPDETRQREAEEEPFYTPEEEARINEYEMWGSQGRPRGLWL